MNKKVTLLIDSLRPGGAERVCVNLANALSKRGVSVTLLVMNFSQYGSSYKLSDEVDIVDLKVSNARYALIPLLNYFYKRNSGTVICFNYELTILLALLIKFVPNISFKLITRNINSLSKIFATSNSFFRKKIVFPLVRWSYKQCDLVVNQCKGMKDEVELLIPEANNKTIYIYNIVSREVQYVAENTNWLKVEKENYLLYVGRLESQKGLKDLINAFSQISGSYPNLRLKIVGTGRQLKELQDLACRLEIGEKVDFEGFRENVIDYYKKAKAVLLTSNFEGFPNVLVEAVSLGIPIISYDCSHGPKEIINNENGYLVELKNINQFSAAIDSLMNRSFDSFNIRAKAAELYFEDKIINQWLGVL